MDVRRIADDYWSLHRQELHFYNLYLGDLTFLESWNDYSPEGDERVRSEFESIRRRALEAATQVTGAELTLSETVAAAADMNASEMVWEAELMLPNLQSGLIPLLLPLLGMQPLRTARDGERYLAKIAAFPAMIDQLVGRLRSGADTGIVPIASNVAQTLEKLDELLAAQPSESRFASQPAPSDDNDPGWHQRLVEAVQTHMIPALRHLADTLRQVTLPVSRPDERPGLCHLPGGGEVYARMAKAYTTLDSTPEEIHQIGLDQMERLESEYRDLVEPLLGTSDIGEIYDRLRHGDGLHHQSAETVVADALRCLEKAKAAMGDWFGVLPQADCIGSPIDVGAMAYYRNPSDDGTVPGQFFFNTADPSAWAIFQVPAVAYHEAIPGHHLDTALSMENRSLHDIHRLVYIPAFGEGWALYTERLADEMGLYESDWERLGMLMGDSLRAGRLVVDTGMHALGWTRWEAIDYLFAHSPMSLFEITEEIDRYIGMPAQALAYMLGRLEIDDLRAAAEARLGSRFDIKGFHDTILGSGTVPLGTLRRRVEEWTAGRA